MRQEKTPHRLGKNEQAPHKNQDSNPEHYCCEAAALNIDPQLDELSQCSRHDSAVRLSAIT